MSIRALIHKGWKFFGADGTDLDSFGASRFSAGHIIRENGTDQTARAALNFVDADAGAGLVTDDAGNNATDVNLNLYRLEAQDHSHQSTGFQAGILDHGLALTGLTDDDHTQYALLAGRNGGQTLKGGTASGDDLTLMSTNNATKGHIIIGGSSWDETNQVIGLGSLDPNAITTVPGYFVQGNTSVVFQGRAFGAGSAVVLLAQASRGTLASPTALQSGDNFFAFNCYGNENTTPSFGLTAQLFSQATENISTTAHGSKWTFATTLNGTTTLANALTIDNDGSLVVHKATGFIDLSAITAGAKNFKITATSDTPTVTWGAGAETIKASAAPAGYLEILVGANTRYIPFWA